MRQAGVAFSQEVTSRLPFPFCLWMLSTFSALVITCILEFPVASFSGGCALGVVAVEYGQYRCLKYTCEKAEYKLQNGEEE